MTRASAFWTGVVVLGILAILSLRPAVASAADDWVWWEGCQCWIWAP